MEEIVFSALPRDLIGKHVKAIRREGRLPAVIYGRGIPSLPISLDHHSASLMLTGVSSSHLVVVDVEGNKHNTLVKDRQYHPVTGSLLHVDFLEVSMTEKLRADVSVVMVGEAPAIKEHNGVLVVGQEQIEVECLPADLPEYIEVDVSGLHEIGDALYVRDISLPGTIEVLTDVEEMLVLVTAPAMAPEEEVEEEFVEEDAEPEVLEKGKKDEGEDF